MKCMQWKMHDEVEDGENEKKIKEEKKKQVFSDEMCNKLNRNWI